MDCHIIVMIIVAKVIKALSSLCCSRKPNTGAASCTHSCWAAFSPFSLRRTTYNLGYAVGTYVDAYVLWFFPYTKYFKLLHK
jgi:hypothetical protein